jgi:glyoxylase I family protein
VYCHLFFALADGGALAFFKFAEKGDEELFGPKMPDSPFHHIALNVDKETQQGIEQRLVAAGYQEPRMYVLEHGYCRSVYVTDPNGLILEFTLDHPKVKEINATRQANAHAELKRWMAGDHTSNNTYR